MAVGTTKKGPSKQLLKFSHQVFIKEFGSSPGRASGSSQEDNLGSDCYMFLCSGSVFPVPVI